MMVMMNTRCVDGHEIDVCLLIAQADIEKTGKIKLCMHQTLQHFGDSRPYGTRSFGAQTHVHLTRNLQALDRVIRTIGELCARRLDRISRLNIRQQGDRALGVHSARVGKYIDVSILLLPKSVVATRVRR
jgi:hypothetical protein